MKKFLTVRMPDHSLWAVPVMMIAQHRAANYAAAYNGDVERSLQEGTLPYFHKEPLHITAWAVRQMLWDDFFGHQIKLCDGLQESPLSPLQILRGWVTGEKGFTNDVI